MALQTKYLTPIGAHGLKEAKAVEKTIVQSGYLSLAAGYQGTIQVDNLTHQPAP